MRLVESGLLARAVGAGAFAVCLSLSCGNARADNAKTYVMKITLPSLNDPSHQFAKNYAAAIERDSGGRIKPEIYPAGQLGPIPRQIEGTQFGAIQCAVMPPDFFVGVDERFEALPAPGLVSSMAQGQRLAADPAVRKLILGLGADKGLHGAALFMNAPSSVISKKPIRHLADFNGKKMRIFASQFQIEAFKQIGSSPVAMSLGDVLPALQQGTIDGSLGGIVVFTPMHFVDAAKYVTETGQPAVFVVVEINKKWYESLPADLRKIIDDDATAQSVAINPTAVEIVNKARKGWTNSGGELISLPPDEQAKLLKIQSSVAAEVAKARPKLNEAYQVVSAASQRTK